jgi:Fe2+ transport system protein FeoA
MDINNVFTLNDLNPVRQARVVAIKTKTVEQLQELMQAGLLLNARINIIHRDRQHILFFSNNKELAVDREVASEIHVEPDE